MPDQRSSAFISYCRADEEFALRLAQDLKDAGAAVWLDQLELIPGHSWDNAIEDALRAATKMLVILTPTSVRSENVRDEIAYALQQGKIVIPVLYLECEIPLRLQRKQHVDFRTNYARGVDRLLRELHVDNSIQEAEAERLRLQKQAEQEQAREVEAERLRLEEQAKQERAREAERLRLEELAKQEQALEETLRREQELKQRAAPPQPKSPDPRPLEAERQIDVKSAASRPSFWQRKDFWASLAAILLAGGFASVLILGFVIFLSQSSAPNTASQPQPIAVQPTPQQVIPQPSVVAPPSPSTSEPNPAKAEKTPPASTPVVTRPQPTAGSKPDFAAIAKKGATLFNSKRYAEAVPLLTRACDGGGAGSCNTLGFMYQNHQGVAQDYGKANTLFTKACDGGETTGCNNLGFSYDHAMGVTQDYSKANTLYTKACDGGNTSGCNNLGILYENGRGVPRDYGKANILYTKSCDGGNAYGCNDLGSLYEQVAQEYGKALTLYTKACELGGATGCSNLGNLYRTGHGVGVNPVLARQYLKKGCDMGNTWGCDRLKEMN